MFRTGIGYDVHRFSRNTELVLGGISIPYSFGLLGYSDGDVLIHSIIDSVLGACSMGDIGDYFPSDDPKLENISSMILLSRTNQMIKESNWGIENIDATIIAEKPRLKKFVKQMENSIANTLEVLSDQINIKCTTTDGLGMVGQGEGISVISIATVQK
ncbi:MAG: 2-C-methyl-D-erythritol 2,4-cyclodiphosphate synthase [SAR202 cluster bacterium]|nr:2-C-methyl-D-erythritol 2,4-cyclodiphosphate synthase [SAR202 cluster bacterium]|tara:strand:- start:1010 stop:1483 length:474 start_codon:yes stop_codon:yes gene_type:complete